MTTTDIIDILQHHQSGGPVESRPKGTAEEYRPDPEPSWDFVGREYRKSVEPPQEVWLISDVAGKSFWSTTYRRKPGGVTLRYILDEPSANGVNPSPQEPLRNPENIDFKEHPIPEGYRVVTEGEMKAAGKWCPIPWMIWYYGWIPAYGNTYKRPADCELDSSWTYLCPVDWRAK